MKTNFLKVVDRNEIILHSEGQIEQRWEALPAGIYRPSNFGGLFETIIGFTPVKLNEKLVNFTTGVVSEILKKAKSFFSEECMECYKEMGIAQKMGIILYGPPGTGKTCTTSLIMQNMVEKYNAICLDFTGKTFSWIKEVITSVRQVQSNPIILFSDECENNLKEEESAWLYFLDGNDSITNIIFLGNTNYFNKIPKRIRQRKSRIKYAYEIKSLPYEVYKEYIQEKTSKLSEKQVHKLAYEAGEAGLVIDELKHALLSIVLEGASISEAIEEATDYKKQED